MSPQPHSKAVPFSLGAEVQPYTLSRSDTPSTMPLSHHADPFVSSVIVTSVPRPRYHQHDNDPDRQDGLISDSYGNFIWDVRGQGDLHPVVGLLPHPVAHLLLLPHFQKVGTPLSSMPSRGRRPDWKQHWNRHHTAPYRKNSRIWLKNNSGLCCRQT